MKDRRDFITACKTKRELIDAELTIGTETDEILENFKQLDKDFVNLYVEEHGIEHANELLNTHRPMFRSSIQQINPKQTLKLKANDSVDTMIDKLTNGWGNPLPLGLKHWGSKR